MTLRVAKQAKVSRIALEAIVHLTEIANVLKLKVSRFAIA